MGTRYLSNMVESHLLRGLMLKCVLFNTNDQVDRFIDELKVKFNITKEVLA